MSKFTPEQLAYMEAHIDESRVRDMYWIYCSAIAVAVISTILRVSAKRYTRNGVALDDYLAILAVICIVGECIINFITGIPNGLGRHVIVVESAEALRAIQKGQFVFTAINTWSVLFVKLSILTFYYRVFPIPSFQRVVVSTVIFMVVWSISVWAVTTFGCLPVRKWWISEVPGHCISLLQFGIVANVGSILSDFFIFLMPVPLLWKLKVSLARRFMLCGIFSLGLATCVLTVLRVFALFQQTADFTWSNVPTAAYYVFEPVGGLLCINIPFIARAVRRKIKARQSNVASDNSSPYNKPPDSKGDRNKRHSRWLRGIDSIQLTGMSSRRRSMVGGVDVQQKPWIPIIPNASVDNLSIQDRPGLKEGVVHRPEDAFCWDEMMAGDGSARQTAKANRTRIDLEHGGAAGDWPL